MTDTAPPLAAFRGPVTCRSACNALILSGAATDSPEELLILTFIDPAVAELPGRMSDVAVSALGERRYRLTTDSRDWTVEATSVHLHRDIGKAFYRAVPPRRAPLTKRLFWRAVLALAATRAGKRLLLSLRRQS